MRCLVSIMSSLNGHEFEQTLGFSGEHRSLACCSPWHHKESTMTEQQQRLMSRCLLQSTVLKFSLLWLSFPLYKIMIIMKMVMMIIKIIVHPISFLSIKSNNMSVCEHITYNKH